jgi:hypothetical protein
VGRSDDAPVWRRDSILIGSAFDISVPRAGWSGAAAAFPYQSRLGGTAESALEIWTFDTKSQFWSEHGADGRHREQSPHRSRTSRSAVMQPGTAAGWKAAVEPRRSFARPAAAADRHRVFLVDTSRSMSSATDRAARREAKAFVAMRHRDSAAIVEFESFASCEIGLTTLDSSANVPPAIGARPDELAGGGTSISAAVPSRS